MIRGAPTLEAPLAPAPPWHCDPNAIVCPHEHMLKLHRTGYHGDYRRMVGVAFFRCETCDTSFMALFTRDPSPIVLCYAISPECYRDWTLSDEPAPPIRELLYRLRDPNGRSHNPQWRPSR